jgi:hypothetical protein
MTEIRVAICVPTSGIVKGWFEYSLASLIAHCGANARLAPEVSSFSTSLFQQETSVIHANRESLVKQGLEWGATHIMFLDDDMVFPASALDHLLSRRQPFVAANYPKKQFPITFTAVRLDGKGPCITDKNSFGLEEVNYTGFGVSLIERSVFEQTPKPWFLPVYVPEHDMYTTEDNPFCQRIRAQGFKVFVDHDLSRQIGHIGHHCYRWSDQIIVEHQDGK